MSEWVNISEMDYLDGNINDKEIYFNIGTEIKHTQNRKRGREEDFNEYTDKKTKYEEDELEPLLPSNVPKKQTKPNHKKLYYLLFIFSLFVGFLIYIAYNLPENTINNMWCIHGLVTSNLSPCGFSKTNYTYT